MHYMRIFAILITILMTPNFAVHATAANAGMPTEILVAQAQQDNTRTAPQAKGADLPRIAVRDIAVNDSIPTKNLDRELLLAEIENALRGTRKFSVLTRQTEAMQAIREEQQFASSSLSDGKGSYEGAMKATQFILVPKVQRFSLYRDLKPVPNIADKYVFSDHGLLELSVQVLDTSTAEIKSTLTLRASRATEEEITNSNSKAPNKNIYVALAKSAAGQLSSQLISAIFPMLVIKTSADTIWVNAGGDSGMKKGQILDIYAPGEELIDPYTNERLGSAESLVGKAKIVNVTPKFSTAKMLDGADAMQGYIVRIP